MECNTQFQQSGLTIKQKFELIEEISKYARVFISSEKALPPKFDKYLLRISPHRLHDAHFYAAMYIGEGATTASECAVLGIPALYVNTISVGYLEQEERYGLVYCYNNATGLVEKAISLLRTPGTRDEFKQRRQIMLDENIDVTSFLIWFVENYPRSKYIMLSNPDFQNSFR